MNINNSKFLVKTNKTVIVSEVKELGLNLTYLLFCKCETAEQMHKNVSIVGFKDEKQHILLVLPELTYIGSNEA